MINLQVTCNMKSHGISKAFFCQSAPETLLFEVEIHSSFLS